MDKIETSEAVFCRVYNEFFGENVDNTKQITYHKLSGDDLHRFTKYYFWSVMPENLQQKIESQHRLSRKAFILSCLAVLIALLATALKYYSTN